MIRRPPRSTPFPYTTPFRSRARLAALKRAYIPAAALLAAWLLATLDRKSTRLNSSHANISYVVFCLEKKEDYLHNAIESLNMSLRNVTEPRGSFPHAEAVAT